MDPDDRNQEKESGGASFDGYAEQKTEPGTTEGNSADGGGGAMEKGGCVYFVETSEGQFVKIGFTKSLRSRIRQLEGTLRPTPIRFLGYIPGSIETEAFFQRRFAAQRERGEWFRDSTGLRGFIATLGLLQVPDARANPAQIIRKLARRPANEPVPRSAVSLVMAQLGRAGGHARAKSLTAEQLKAAGRRAITARWAKGKA